MAYRNPWKRRGSEWVRLAECACRCRTCGSYTWPHQPIYEVRPEEGFDNELSVPSKNFCAECLEQHFQPTLFGG